MGSYLLKPQNAGKPHRLRAETTIGRTRGQLRFAKDKLEPNSALSLQPGDRLTVGDPVQTLFPIRFE